MTSLHTARQKKNLVLYFQVHQPKRLRTLRFFDIGSNKPYFNEDLNREIIERIARDCYLPANALLLTLIHSYPGIRIAFSISGVAIDQFEEYAPEVLASFKALAATGSVEFLAETYYHSLACLMPGSEFELQVEKHQKKIFKHFGMASRVFRNTELIHSDETGVRIRKLGFEGVMIDGIDRMRGDQSPHHLFEHAGVEDLKLILRDYRLSDDISFRFSQASQPLDAARYISWLRAIPQDETLINLSMDYETFGEHQKKDSDIFSFLETLLSELAIHPDFRFMTPSEAMDGIPVARPLAVPGYISWADEERDLSAWLGNEMQRDAFDSLSRMESDVKNLYNRQLLGEWRYLQTSDHFYYMSTKKGNDGEVHSYFSPYPSPYEAFINYMNVLTDLHLRIKAAKASAPVLRQPNEAAFRTELAVGV